MRDMKHKNVNKFGGPLDDNIYVMHDWADEVKFMAFFAAVYLQP